MTKPKTCGLFSLHCACGKDVKSIDIVSRSPTGREVVRHYCHDCGCISWWWRTFSPAERVMLFDREERDSQARRWPPAGWMHRHAPRLRR